VSSRKPKTFWPQMARFWSLGLELALAIAIGILAGIYLDRRAGTLPLFTVSGLLFGIILGFYNLFRTTRQFNKDKGP